VTWKEGTPHEKRKRSALARKKRRGLAKKLNFEEAPKFQLSFDESDQPNTFLLPLAHFPP
jgi:hypothetical protein